jgi:hypothetical protein
MEAGLDHCPWSTGSCCVGAGRIGPLLEDCTRTEPAIFAIYVQCSKQTFDSPCNLRTSHSVQLAIFALPVPRCGAIVWDGSSSALILMVPAVWLGRTLDRNGPGTVALDYKGRSSQGRGIGFRFVPRQKEVIRARFVQQNRHHHSHLRTGSARSSRTMEWHKTVLKAATLCHFAEQSSCRLTMAENLHPTRLAFRHG